MRAKTIIILSAGVLTAAAIGFAWKEHLATRVTRVSLAAAAQRRTGLQAQIRRTEAWLAALDKDRASVPSSLEQNRTAAAAEPEKRARTDPPPNPMDLVLNDPKLQLLYLAARRAATATTYTPLFLALGLSPAQKERFVDIVMKREELDQDLMAVMRSRGLPADDPAVAALKQQAADEVKAAQSDLLGADGYQQLQQYERMVPVWAMVAHFSGVAALAGNPLSPQQAEQMRQLLVNSSSTYRSGSWTDFLSIDWDATDQQVAGILTPAQLDLYRTIEPIGVGPSRWTGRLGRAIDQARKTEAAGAALATSGPPGG